MTTGRFEQAEAVLAQVNRDHGTRFTITGALSGGFQNGAWRIVGHDGGEAVLKFSPARDAWTQVVLAAEAKVAAARRDGYPTPSWMAAGVTTGGFVYQVQEFVAGLPAGRLTEPLARQLVDVLERCAAGRAPEPGGDPRSDWSQFVLGRMSPHAPDGLPSLVRALGSSQAAVVERALALLDVHGPVRLPDDDLVHGDLNLGNVLLDTDGTLAGIVDIEALGAGSRAIDYGSLWNGSADNADPEALTLVRAAGQGAAGAAGFAVCAIWSVLEYVVFAAERNGAADGSRAVAAAHRRLDLLEKPLR
jgi:aminoglycoside phosphotransferase (APT) family kinase protein